MEKNGAISPEKPTRPTPSPPLISTDDVSRGVLEIVSESTGYPEEFIEFDADMEGELGIDSIKQAEIMSEIRDRYSLPLDESFQLRDHPTIGHVIRYIDSFTDSNESGRPLEEFDQSAGESEGEKMEMQPQVEYGAPNDEILSSILPIVAQHTGYPVEFLETDADMEGELGIDSIKQAEIMSDIRAQFNLELDEDFQIRDYPTLGHVANYVAGSTDSPAKSGESREPQEEENPPAPIFRHVVVTEAMGDIEIHQLPRLVLVTRDPLGLSDSLVARITRMGGEARIIEEDSLSDAVSYTHLTLPTIE